MKCQRRVGRDMLMGLEESKVDMAARGGRGGHSRTHDGGREEWLKT